MKYLTLLAAVLLLAIPAIGNAYSPTMEVMNCWEPEHANLTEKELAECPEILKEFNEGLSDWENWPTEPKRNWFEGIIHAFGQFWQTIWPW